MIEKEIVGADSWQSLEDVPTDRVFELAELVNKLVEEKKAAKIAKDAKEKNQ